MTETKACLFAVFALAFVAGVPAIVEWLIP